MKVDPAVTDKSTYLKFQTHASILFIFNDDNEIAR